MRFERPSSLGRRRRRLGHRIEGPAGGAVAPGRGALKKWSFPTLPNPRCAAVKLRPKLGPLFRSARHSLQKRSFLTCGLQEWWFWKIMPKRTEGGPPCPRRVWNASSHSAGHRIACIDNQSRHTPSLPPMGGECVACPDRSRPNSLESELHAGLPNTRFPATWSTDLGGKPADGRTRGW